MFGLDWWCYGLFILGFILGVLWCRRSGASGGSSGSSSGSDGSGHGDGGPGPGPEPGEMDGFVYRELATASDGYLTDPDSTILATVELWTPSGTSAVASATTDRGYYRLVVPSSGNYIVKVIGVDAALAGNRQTGILVLNKAKVSHVDFRFTA